MKNKVTNVIGKQIKSAFGAVNFSTDQEKAILKAVSEPASSLVPAFAGGLVEGEYKGFIDLLSEKVAYLKLLKSATRVDLSKTNNLSYSKRDKTAGIGGAFIKPGDPYPVQEGGFSLGLLKPYYTGTIVSFTREVSQKSDLENILIDAIGSDMSEVIDSVFFSADALIADVSPAGIQVGASTETIVTGGACLNCY